MNYNQIINLVKSTKKFIFNENLKNDLSIKVDSDFVTQVDLSISKYLKKELYKLYPDIPFMSEEDDFSTLTNNRWILDPIDGTTNLIFDYKMSSVSLALMQNKEIVFGIVYNPFTNELFTAIKGHGAYLNNNKIVAKDRNIKNCLIEFGLGAQYKNLADENFEIAKDIFKECLDLRRTSSSALEVCYIACGRLNGYFEKILHPWDYAASTLILKESGGKASDWNGNQLQYNETSSIICGSTTAYNFLYNKLKNKL